MSQSGYLHFVGITSNGLKRETHFYNIWRQFWSPKNKCVSWMFLPSSRLLLFVIEGAAVQSVCKLMELLYCQFLKTSNSKLWRGCVPNFALDPCVARNFEWEKLIFESWNVFRRDARDYNFKVVKSVIKKYLSLLKKNFQSELTLYSEKTINN